MPRFVVLRHDGPSGTHFDFMLETEGVLKTWALPRSPEIGVEIDCLALPDHRLAYLDYEGPISGDRGTVTRWDQGTYTACRQSDAEWQVQLIGNRLAAEATLRCEPNDPSRWRFSLAEAEHGSREC